MKIRRGFVSNSSSSSFTCDVCHETESGWDISLEEAGMYGCVNGHYFHESCMSEALPDEDTLIGEAAQYIIESGKLANNYEKFASKRFKTLEEYVYWVAEGDIRRYIPPKHCPICSMDKFTQDDIVGYLLKEASTSTMDITKEIKNRFNSYKEFKDYIKK